MKGLVVLRSIKSARPGIGGGRNRELAVLEAQHRVRQLGQDAVVGRDQGGDPLGLHDGVQQPNDLPARSCSAPPKWNALKWMARQSVRRAGQAGSLPVTHAAPGAASKCRDGSDERQYREYEDRVLIASQQL